MNRDQASALVRTTLHDQFAESRFMMLVRALLKRLDEAKIPSEIAVPAGFASIVKRCDCVASYTDPRGDKLDVLIIALHHAPRRTEDRIALRNFAAHYLETRGISTLLAACVDPGKKSWRFSFITLDNVLESDFTDGAQLRSARSVSIHAGESARDQRMEKPLLSRLQSRSGPPDLNAVEAMFGGGGFAREFCEDCRELFTSQHEALALLGELDAPLISDAGDIAESIAGPLARYPFTAHESEALERELAVDPELLSKVFESLLPEALRHASGTYYTPRVIVRYMCQQALVHHLSVHVPAISREALALFLRISDRLIGADVSSQHDDALIALLRENASHLDALLARVTVYDPAIGCGAFAMGMLHEIVRARLALTPMLQRCDEESRSAAALKRHAIRQSIHGMDADRDAVELTRLRLWLSQAVDDPADSVPLQALGDHIRQGDSLTDDQDRQRSFDIIITNPPYVRVQARASHASPGGDYDLYLGFTALALRQLAAHGTAAFILPHKFFNARYGRGLRRALSSGKHVEHIVYFGDHQVFEGSTSYVCLLFLTRQPSTSFRYVKVEDLDRWYAVQKGSEARLSADRLTESNWNLVIGRGAALHKQLAAMPKKLRQVTRRIFQGLKTSADKIYIVERRGHRGRHVRVLCHHDEQEYLLEPELLHPLIKGGDSKAYALQPTARLILFPYLTREGRTELIPEDILRRDSPLCWQYLVTHREALRAREGGRLDHAGWYGYGRSQALEVMGQPKIFTPDLAPAAAFSFDATGACFFTGGAAGGYGILPAEGESSAYLLGLLNSKVLDWYLQQSTTPMKGGWRSYEARYIRELPIPEATDAQRRIIEQLAQSLLRRDTPRPDLTERWLNALVYELFFPQSLHQAGLQFFELAASDVSTLERCLQRLAALEEVQIIEGVTGRAA